MREERYGEIFILTQAFTHSIFPVIINYSTKLIPPIFFAGVSIIVASIFLFFYILLTGKIKEIFNKKAFKYILGVVIFIVIVPSILIYSGTKLTSGINTSILLQTEIFFTLIICGLFFKEKITTKKLISAFLIIIGSIAILYNKNFTLNWGDLLIIAGSFLYPFGNIFAKKALQLTSPLVIVFIRSFLGGIILILISFMFENTATTALSLTKNFILFILINGIIISAVSKIIWYEGLKRMEIGKAITLGMISPGISLILAIIFLGEIPSVYQVLGFLIITAGAFILTYQTTLTQKSNVQETP